MRRVLTALVLIPAVMWLIFRGPALGVRAVLAAVALLCLHECLTLVRAGGAEPYKWASYAAGAVLVMAAGIPHPAFLIGFAMLLMGLGVKRVAVGPSGRSFAAAAATLFAVVYTCGPYAIARDLYTLSPHWLFVVLVVNWVGDSAALYVGRSIGKHKLAPHVSPGKTWEGTIGSLIFGTAAGTAYLLYFLPEVTTPALAVGLCAVANAAGQFGDLSESALKRAVGVKDSGNLLPGHGGMLDRMDSALFAFPAAYWYLTLARWL